MGRDSFNLLGAQWGTAAHELGVEIQVPYALEAVDGSQIEFACLLRQFGSERGMLLSTTYSKAAFEAATRAGFGFSCVEPADLSAACDLSGYISCLRDWGWAVAQMPPPAWYTEGANAI
jgi:hypothetical protein